MDKTGNIYEQRKIYFEKICDFVEINRFLYFVKKCKRHDKIDT